MVLQLQRAKLSDIPAITRVQTEAFHQSSPIDRIMHPRGLTPHVLRTSCANHERRFNEVNARYLIVIDTELTSNGNSDGTIIAFATWLDQRQAPQTKEAHDASSEDEDTKQSEDVNYGFMSRFFGSITEMKRQHMGDRACMYLSFIATHPSHQGRGAGSMLIRWGLELADREGLECWLTGSPAAYLIYRHHGFSDVASCTIDIAPYLGSENDGKSYLHKNVLMRRDVPARQGSS